MLHETQTAASAIRRAMGVMLALAATSCGSDAPETPNETSTITIESTLTTVPTTTSIAPQPTTTATTASSIPELATTAPTTDPTTTTAEPTSTTETADTTTTVAVNGPEEGATGSSDRAIQPQSADNPFGDNFDLAPLPDPLPGRPDWYGKRPLAMGDDGIAIAQPTPPELENRAFPTIDRLPPPITDDFYADVREVPDAIVARSTWTADCPVTLDELRYVRVSHWGFEGKVHTGEMLLNARVADDVVSVFRRLFEIEYPIESLRVADQSALDTTKPTTGDGNGSGAFVCRAAKKSSRWSDHAYGTAIDLNSFQNPYKNDDTVIPELATSYLDRGNWRPGMIASDGQVRAAFKSIGWGWGGAWNNSKDYMHFSESGR